MGSKSFIQVSADTYRSKTAEGGQHRGSHDLVDSQDCPFWHTIKVPYNPRCTTDLHWASLGVGGKKCLRR